MIREPPAVVRRPPVQSEVRDRCVPRDGPRRLDARVPQQGARVPRNLYITPPHDAHAGRRQAVALPGPHLTALPATEPAESFVRRESPPDQPYHSAGATVAGCTTPPAPHACHPPLSSPDGPLALCGRLTSRGAPSPAATCPGVPYRLQVTSSLRDFTSTCGRPRLNTQARHNVITTCASAGAGTPRDRTCPSSRYAGAPFHISHSELIRSARRYSQSVHQVPAARLERSERQPVLSAAKARRPPPDHMSQITVSRVNFGSGDSANRTAAVSVLCERSSIASLGPLVP